MYVELSPSLSPFLLLQKKALGKYTKCASDNELLTVKFSKKLRSKLSFRRNSLGKGLDQMPHHPAATNRWVAILAH